jgi:retron-type reverse transcriptase
MTVVRKTSQLVMHFGPTENRAAQASRVNDEAVPHRRGSATLATPKPQRKINKAMSTTMEEIVRLLPQAFSKVAANKGAPGPDRQSTDDVREHLPLILPRLGNALLEGSYTPGDIRRVWIPKAGGGERGLGIPNVIDRMVQEAVRQVLEPLYEPTFHASSHGFRPERSCHTAIAEAQQHIAAGYTWVVDIDLEKFFDRVNHQRLLDRLSQRVTDKTHHRVDASHAESASGIG